MEEQNINEQFLNQITAPSTEMISDAGEIFIDEIVKNDALKEIPIIKTIVGAANIGITINQYFMAKKVIEFVRGVNDGTIDDNTYNAFKHKIESDYHYGQKVAEKLLVMIDKQVEITQTKITANLFKAFVKEQLTYDELNAMLISLNNLHPSTYSYFSYLEQVGYKIGDEIESAERNWEMENLVSSSGIGMRVSAWSSGFWLNPDGVKLYELGIKPLQIE